jgi:hypothetical protein
MKRLMAMGCMVGVMMLAGGHAFADEVIKNRVAADTLEKFQVVAADVRADMGVGGRYEFIHADEKVKVDSDLDAMAAMLQKSGSVSAMSQPDKVRLFDTQEHLNGMLTHSDRNRLVCEHSAPVGTSIPRTTCQTVAEIEHNRKDGQTMIKRAGDVGSVCRRFCRSD